MLRGSSAESFVKLSNQLSEAVDAGADAARLADDLFAAVEVFRKNPHFRRAASDPTGKFEARAAMVRDVFAPHLSKEGAAILEAAASTRWTSSLDLIETMEKLGVIAVARSCDQAGEGDRLESEMFGFGQIIAKNPPLREALTDRTRSVADKQALLRSLLEGKACAGTIRLAEQAVTGDYRTVRLAFDDYARIATESRGRKVATVRVARPLGESEQERLAAALTRQYHSAVHLNIVIDPETIGGIEVDIDGEVIDGTIASRLADARRRIAS